MKAAPFLLSRRGSLGGQRSECPARGHDDIDLERDQFGRVSGEAPGLQPRPAVFESDVLALDITVFAQPLAEGVYERDARLGEPETEIADHRHRLLLRAGGERHGNRRATEKRYELAVLHSITAANTDG